MRLAALALLAAAGCSAQQAEEPRAIAEPGIADGGWRITHVDDRPIERRDIFVMIEDQQIVGGYDGCNAWGIEEIDGKRVVMSDAMACPGDPLLVAMQSLEVVDQSAIELSLRKATSPAPVLHIDSPQHAFQADYAIEFGATAD